MLQVVQLARRAWERTLGSTIRSMEQVYRVAERAEPLGINFRRVCVEKRVGFRCVWSPVLGLRHTEKKNEPEAPENQLLCGY